ncbi:undecaprenyl-diphosphate phosphatase [Paenibacillus apiarius]|uniref:Undecaprenyl-diphosphatase n=1 Tax=Paenibacillus apiarius TaxID=46240 RepID=A0ABT4DN47_9BACL|nr:undecaprenyl-diphosphate phosphatase [Paenibacillus apiarius]MCY9517348.1 undecaprenyl-diphosphate phosphatase [Paenibacillus apiarius]MCY9518781.1 undecaprenyl-diphosphate phosphatase [Paenibacillus apiarius]MCY9552778.1 undecaprenyl-diphosphate phosphatase [Paenibacillus apiarius]MCY9556803.1 undecaprenyl-diphosphate phosphatase [Paenibacillus apiarius]MCY9684298.1 undecaprenyl-diphosphate phosphatase [Paenibacillus apiarius]
MEWLDWLKYAVLGLVQGFTEPIPVSSSGHLVIAEKLFGLHMEGLGFEVLVNFASLLAILLIYRQDIVRLAVNTFRFMLKRDPDAQSDFMFVIYLILATIPAGVIGVVFKDTIADVFKGVKIIGATLLITALALWLIRNLRGRKGDKDLSFGETFIVGLAQSVALIPGISRSGATIVAAMALGWKQETALRFSFFLYIPVSLGSMILEGKDMIKDPMLGQLIGPYLLAFICSFVASYFALKWFMGLMARGNLKWFSLYCVFAGLLVLFFMN